MNMSNNKSRGNRRNVKNQDNKTNQHSKSEALSRQNKMNRGDRFEGRVQMTRQGFAFVIVDDMEDDIFINAYDTAGALNGDRVVAKVMRPKVGDRKCEGKIVKIIERSPRPFVGVLHIIGSQAWVLMESKNMPYDIAVRVLAPNGKPAKNSNWFFSRRKNTENDNLTGCLIPRGDDKYIVKGLHETVNGKTKDLVARSGMKVAVKVYDWPKGESNPLGKIIDIMGIPGDNDTEMHAILAEYALPYRFEPEVENAAEHISEKITEEDVKSRRDFRDVLTCTIDPKDAKDFDDALSFRKLKNGNYEVGVHIADVTHYVTPGSIVDKEARERGTSVYLVDRTVPMLPEKLSNKLCSLRPGEDKLTFSAVFELSEDANVVSSWFGRTIICSDYRFAYETAQQIIEAGPKALDMDLRGGSDGKNENNVDDESGMGGGVYEGCVIPREGKEAVLKLDELAHKIRERRFRSGAISFDRPEMKIEVDEKGRPIRVYQKISKEANWLIEEFMLLANRYVAEFVATGGHVGQMPLKNPKTFVYRVHDEPNSEKIQGLSAFAHNFGYKMGKTNNGKEISKSLNALLEKSKDKPEFAAIEILALRSMAKAEYSTDNIGHYGLAFRYYTHFTSPIRRYPDMLVHRLLAMYLDGAQSQKKDLYDGMCKYASEREIVAAEAERASIKYKLVEFMKDKVGQEFDGHISGLTDWGMYVEIEPTKIEGMVPLRDIHSDFYDFDQEKYLIRGRSTGKVFHLGDAVRIKVKSADMQQKLLDYELVEK